mgnify:CR=1 FL=1
MSISLTVKAFLTNLFLILFVSSTSEIFAQEDWIEYVIIKDKGVMAVSLDLNFDLNKPNYRNLVVAGAKFKKCRKNGFPADESLNDVYAFSDSISIAIDKITSKRLVALLTYQCVAFDIYYVKDTIRLRDEMTASLEKKFNPSLTYIDIKKDKNWDYYENYLYPRDFSSEFLVDQNYLHDLVLQGDDLKGERKVNHWIYFKSIKKRNQFGTKVKELEFSLDSIAYKRERSFPYELNISRKDSIDPLSVYHLTSMLRLLSNSMLGQYAGWSTEVKPKD